MEELEKKVLEIVNEKHIKSGGNNGNLFYEFDEVLQLPLEERNALLQKMHNEHKIVIREGQNGRLIMLPK
jgi:hypothetical protein